MSLNGAAFALLIQAGGLKDKTKVHVQLLYDPEEQVVGFRPVPSETPDSYPVRKQARSESYLVAGMGFVAFHAIEAATDRRYTVRSYGDGIVGFSLREGGDQELGR